jgi:hypothetical protein
MAQTEERPEVSLDRSSVDFGRYPANEERTASFILKNSGMGELKLLRISKTCGCSEATASKLQLGPGEEAKIDVSILKESLSGNFAKNVFVETNALGNRLLQLQVAGNAIPLVEIKPKAIIDLGRIAPGGNLKQSFLLSPVGAAPFVPGKPRSEGNCENVLAELKKAEGGAWALDVVLTSAPMAKGSVKVKVAVPILEPEGWKPLELLLTARIGAELLATPSSIEFSELNGEGLDARIKIKGLGLPAPLSIADLEFEKPPFISAKPLLGDDGQLLIELKQSSKAGPQAGPFYLAIIHKPSNARCLVTLCIKPPAR